MFHVVLFQPEIPPNAGNVIRLTANTGCRLHLVEPLGFSLDDRQLKRAGLDYHALTHMSVHRDWAACLSFLNPERIFALTTRARRSVFDASFREEDVFVFGPETTGLPAAILNGFSEDRKLRLPMRPANRSINLSNAVAVTVFEAWRQLGFRGSA
ncbi:MAG: tRNA (cytidine(34)-2'-O)-methyltransferase [Betaproteobacteria bacterium]